MATFGLDARPARTKAVCEANTLTCFLFVFLLWESYKCSGQQAVGLHP